MDEKLIFTTNGLCKTSILPAVLGGFGLTLIGLLAFSWIGFLLTLFFMIIIVSVCVSKQMAMKNSYIDLYESVVKGKTINDGVNTFELSYADITNVAYQNNIVRIYFNGGEHLVQATNCEQKVVDIIKERRAEILSKLK